jgi:DNA helicase II / ATP-dependent DNA helicase PcrA
MQGDVMELIVDLHVHSHYSRATSKDCNLEGLYRWGKVKGINIIGTGDFTHPAWFAEIRENLEPAEHGLFKLKDELAQPIDQTLPASVRDNLIRFIPTVEIATIYKKGDKVRKLHQLIVMPDFKSVSELNARLERIGNLKADGRPILGLDSKELLRHVLEVNPDGLYIPAHIWTPWFGMFGSKSGFDSIAEAYDELAPEIRAIETGLSSDPFMNWRIVGLDGIAVTSHSDAHSPGKLGREATVVRSQVRYDDIIGALKTNDQRLVGTVEFFPEEGKYHYDGHRACGVRLTPEETKAHGGLCPKCTKPLVVGVDYRVSELATRPADHSPTDPKQVEYIIPLIEILAELQGVKSTSGKAVQASYHQAIERLGDEFGILRHRSIEEVQAASIPLLHHAIEKLRTGDVVREPGYDGLFGTIKVFKNSTERMDMINQTALL